MDYKIEYKNDIEKIRSVYRFYNGIEELVGKEFTFTVAPGRCTDIQETKKQIMSMVVQRCLRSDPVAFILTRENHKSGWPHIHGIGWYPKERDNSLTLTEGYRREKVYPKGKRHPVTNIYGAELGRTAIFPLRTEPYKQKRKDDDIEETQWDNWLEYILKDQGVNWKDPNAIIRKDVKLTTLFKKYKTESDFVD